MSAWCLRLFVALVLASVLMLGPALPTRSVAAPFGVSQSESFPAPIEGVRATAFAVDHYVVDARLTPAESYQIYTRGLRQMPSHSLVPQSVLARIKAAALVNPYAPRDPFARPDSDLQGGMLTPALMGKFAGLSNLDGSEPPDMAVAASPNWVVQGVNVHFSVFNRSGVVQTGWPKSFVSFFHVPSPGSCHPTPFMSDPRVFYNRADQRFIFAALQVDGPIIGTTCAPLSKYWIAVSQTNNPSGKWNVYAFDMRFGTSNVADYTQIGYDANGIYFSGNMYSSSTGNFVYAEILGASKAAMESGSSVLARGFSNLKIGGIPVDTVHPAVELVPPSQPVEFFINSKNILNCTAICNGVTVWAFANVLGTPSLTAVSVATKNYSTPPSAVQPGGTINTDDQRISGTPVFQGGLLTFALNTAVKNSTMTVAGVLWGQAKPVLTGSSITSASIFQSGYLSFTGNRSAYYGAMVPDSRGNLYMAFDSSSSTLDASGYYTARKVTDSLGTLETPVKAIGGTATYPFSRWGDYSAVAIDGNTTTSDVWFATEYAVPSNWKTEIWDTRF